MASHNAGEDVFDAVPGLAPVARDDAHDDLDDALDGGTITADDLLDVGHDRLDHAQDGSEHIREQVKVIGSTSWMSGSIRSSALCTIWAMSGKHALEHSQQLLEYGQ
jgi:hypothetical protein